MSDFTQGLDAASSAHATSGVSTLVDAKYAVVTSMLETTVRNRRRHFLIKNIAGV
jgi:hypothetical protein